MTVEKSGGAGGYILFGTSACHLCELAEDLLLSRSELVFEKVDISESDQLFERYGVRIPVLKAPDGTELGWPFDGGQLDTFLGQSG
jgi:Glutaredoxin-like domain (DUF836)